MSGAESEKSPLDQLLDVGVYAPIGFLVAGDQVFNDLATAGREQLAFSRSLGRAALKTLAKGADRSSRPTTDPVEVPGYESMTARDVIALVATCTSAEADWIRTAEAAGKARVTVLRALDARPT